MEAPSAAVCDKCVLDEVLSAHIRATGTHGHCALCDGTAATVLEVVELRPMFEPIVALYEDAVQYMSIEVMKDCAHLDTLDSVLDDEWQLFVSPDATRKFLKLCTFDHDPSDHPGEHRFDPDRAIGPAGLRLEESDHSADHAANLWLRLEASLKEGNRFFVDDAIIAEIDALPTTTAQLPEALFRARIDHDRGGLRPDQLGAPPSAVATPGRANPRGISYLYMASNEATAIAEVRPHVGDRVVCGEFVGGL